LNLIKLSWGRKKKALLDDSGVFTDHVRLLAARDVPLDRERLESLWKALRATLRGELKRRGLWEAPPTYLGIYGWETWELSGGGRGGALEELLAECYAYIFVLRFRSLEAQLKLKPNIDGLVILNIRHFLHERQKEHDPLGSQVFEVLQSAVRMALEEGDLFVLEGDGRVRNETVLSFSANSEGRLAPREGLAALVSRWNDDLLPDLVTLRGRRHEEVVRRLYARLPDLRREGFDSFRFKDLIDPMKADVRARWAALFDLTQGEVASQPGEGEPGERVRLVPPDTQTEERQVFRKLVDCVLTSLERLEVGEKTRRHLTTLWQFVRLQASQGEDEAPPSWRLDPALQIEVEEDRPSLRKLAEQLRIPRERLPNLYQTLGELLERCHSAISGKTAVTSIKGSSTLGNRRLGSDDH